MSPLSPPAGCMAMGVAATCWEEKAGKSHGKSRDNLWFEGWKINENQWKTHRRYWRYWTITEDPMESLGNAMFQSSSSGRSWCFQFEFRFWSSPCLWVHFPQHVFSKLGSFSPTFRGFRFVMGVIQLSWMTGWWFGTWILWLSIQLGMSSSQLTNSIIFQRGRYTTSQTVMWVKLGQSTGWVETSPN